MNVGITDLVAERLAASVKIKVKAVALGNMFGLALDGGLACLHVDSPYLFAAMVVDMDVAVGEERWRGNSWSGIFEGQRCLWACDWGAQVRGGAWTACWYGRCDQALV